MDPIQPYVLVVEDDADNLIMLVDSLTTRGHTVRGAPDGISALSQVQRCVPHLMLLDLAMPDIDGLEVARAMKADRLTAEIIIIAVTARTGPDDRANAFAAGCDAFVTKPYDLTVLDLAVDAIMRDGRTALPRLDAVGSTPRSHHVSTAPRTSPGPAPGVRPV